jgi:protein O-mannosyl-transferase
MKKKKGTVKSPRTEAPSGKHSRHILWLLMAVTVAATLFCYKDSVHGEFTNWDDTGYVSENMELREFGISRVADIFTHFSMGNYHPFVMLSYNILYLFFRLNPAPYHIFNIAFHVVNTLLVFYFIYRLSGRKPVPGFIASFLFGVHPLHVESVAWISATKDVLYAFFYLAGLITYLRCKESRQKGYYVATLGLFLFSCLAKAMAVTFPVALFLIDYYRARSMRFSRESILEKLPLLSLSTLFGVTAMFAQKSINAVGEVTTTGFAQHIFVAAHGVWFYIYKMLLPVHLSAFYPYPKLDGSWMPGKYLISPVIAALLLLLLYKSWRRGHSSVAFGISFYLLNIAPVLQFLPVGAAVAADRYFYVSSIGLFFVIGIVAETFWSRDKMMSYAVVVVLGGTLVFLTVERTKVWQNSLNLWESVLSEYPDYPGAAVAYNNIGMIYRRMEQYDLAFRYTQRALELDTHYGLAYKNMGALYGKTGNLKEAERYLLEAVKYSPEDYGVYNNLGILYAMTGRPDQAREAFGKALSLEPNNAETYNNLGNLSQNTGATSEAVKYYEKAVLLNREKVEPYLELGKIYSKAGDTARAAPYYIEAARLGSPAARDWLTVRNIPF